MASDWIKMRTDLYRDPKVCLIADALMDRDSELSRYVSQNKQSEMTVTRNVMRNVTVGALVTVWGVLRHRGTPSGTDLLLKSCTLSIIDDIADLPGFGYAMDSVGWAKQTAQGVVLPGFFGEMNVDPLETVKAKNAERQRRFREKNSNVTSNVTGDVTITHREEKSREEKSIKTEEERSAPLPFSSVEFMDAWSDWEKNLSEKRKPLKPTARRLQLKKLAAMGEARAIAALKHSATNQWTGLFEPDATTKPQAVANSRALPASTSQADAYAKLF